MSRRKIRGYWPDGYTLDAEQYHDQLDGEWSDLTFGQGFGFSLDVIGLRDAERVFAELRHTFWHGATFVDWLEDDD